MVQTRSQTAAGVTRDLDYDEISIIDMDEFEEKPHEMYYGFCLTDSHIRRNKQLISELYKAKFTKIPTDGMVEYQGHASLKHLNLIDKFLQGKKLIVEDVQKAKWALSLHFDQIEKESYFLDTNDKRKQFRDNFCDELDKYFSALASHPFKPYFVNYVTTIRKRLAIWSSKDGHRRSFETFRKCFPEFMTSEMELTLNEDGPMYNL